MFLQKLAKLGHIQQRLDYLNLIWPAEKL